MFINVSNNLPRDISGCGISGFINTNGRRASGRACVDSICMMRDRGNGLGAGFAVYGAYPEFRDYYAIHIIYQDNKAREETEEYLSTKLSIVQRGGIPTKKTKNIQSRPLFFVYFGKPRAQSDVAEIDEFREDQEDEFIVRLAMKINENIKGAYVISSGKNLGVFKGIGFPEDIAEMFMIDDYKGYCWIAHNRYPTNTPGWWGGAHPFSVLDWSVVHNGEISSYGINKRYLEMFKYNLNLKTDTEVISYLLDLLVRRHGLSLKEAALAFAPPFWTQIEKMNTDQKDKIEKIRRIYGSAMLNGPFAILVGFKGGLMGLSDRIKLRPLVIGQKGDTTYMASEESAIVGVVKHLDRIWSPNAGEPVIAKLKPAVSARLFGKSNKTVRV